MDDLRIPPLPCTVDFPTGWWSPPVITLTDTWTVAVSGKVLTVPSGFVSDGASVPRLWILTLAINAVLSLVRFGRLRALRASVLHDHLYATADLPRRGADRLFRHLLRHDGIGLLGAWAAWTAVRLGGWAHYRRPTRP